MEKKINSWMDYHNLVKKETYKVSNIKDTYVYQLEDKVTELEAELKESEETSKYWRDHFNNEIKKKDELKLYLTSFPEPHSAKTIMRCMGMLDKKHATITHDDVMHGGAHQFFTVDPEEARKILDRTKDQSILLPGVSNIVQEKFDNFMRFAAFTESEGTDDER